ncbi:MAG: hypothetical protein IT318_07115 [Anaerolineales bacterium]|nr:hypothetical protein [Anaerolineales bacterium]
MRPLICRLFGWVDHPSTKLKRQDANRIAGALHEKHKDIIEPKDVPVGLRSRIHDGYTLMPTGERLALGDQEKQELRQLWSSL